jgi:ABC-type cobalamin/Fe3+-siderophores transport system ATPase subunit
LKILKGEFVCIIGKVGAGKSSLLKAIISDMIYIDEKELATYSKSQFN